MDELGDVSNWGVDQLRVHSEDWDGSGLGIRVQTDRRLYLNWR